MLVKLGGKFHEKPSKGEEGLWRVAEMATKNAMFIGQPHTQRHLWRKRNGQKLDREVDSSKSLANSNTYLAHNRVQIFFEGSFLFLLKKQIHIYIVDLQWVHRKNPPASRPSSITTIENGVGYFYWYDWQWLLQFTLCNPRQSGFVMGFLCGIIDGPPHIWIFQEALCSMYHWCQNNWESWKRKIAIFKLVCFEIFLFHKI